MRILIVDDRPLGVRVLRQQIMEAEPMYLVEGANNAHEATRLVREASTPFDIFLVDQNLGLGPDGIELMQELRQLSPRSDAMVFTGYGDPSEGQRAIEAGACDFFTKPVDNLRLLAQLRRLQQERSMRKERDWLQLLAATTKELQEATTVQSAGQAIVRGVQQLGFQRARLSMVCGGQGEQVELIGISQIGNVGLTDDYRTTKRSLRESPYSRRVLIETRKPTLFHGRELGPAPWDEYIGAPMDDWFKVPLFVGDEPIGSLSLDNGADPCRYSSEEQRQLQQLLDIFGKQSAAALERARLHERASRQARKAQILSEIGRAVTTKAAQGSLEALLETIREQLGEKLELDISNFRAVLLDTETNHLDFRCHYERGGRELRHWRVYPRGLVGHLIQLGQGKPLLLQDGAYKAYCETHLIETFGELAQCWLGAPLRVEDETVGALIVLSYEDSWAYDDDDKRLLDAVADQVAGAIHAALQAERERERTRQLDAIQRVSAELPRLAREDEDYFWHTVLTTITRSDGLSFNRAALFMYEENGTRLRGRLGIGDIHRKDAHYAWQQDLQTHWPLEDYLEKRRLGRLVSTPLDRIIPNLEIVVGGEESPLYQLSVSGQGRVTPSSELVRWLPRELVDPAGLPDDLLPITIALIPVKLDNQVLGIVMVDNAFDGEPLYPTALDNLSTLLSQAAQVLDQARAIYRNQAVLRLSQQVMARVSERSLKHSLEDIAGEARNLTKADLAIIYPLQQDGGGYITSDVVAVGLVHEEYLRATNKPRQQGVTGHILRAGTLVVPDVRRNDLTFAGTRLSDHPFLMREQIQAFIGVPVHEPTTGERLGVLYLDYRSLQHFSKPDVALAEDLAQAIATVIRAERDASGREAAERNAGSRELELTLLRDIQEEALSPDTDEKKVIRATLMNGARLFGPDALLKVGLLAWETADGQARPVWHEFSLDTLGRLSRHRASEAHRKIMEYTFQTEEAQHNGPLFMIPIRLSRRAIGAIQVEFSDATYGTPELMQRAERLATAVALALDNVRRLGRFRAVLRAIKAVTEPSDFQAVLGSVVAAAQDAAPGIDCVTLWYEDPITKELIAGPHWGLIADPDTRVREGTLVGNEELVRRVMQSKWPIWTEDSSSGPLRSDFGQTQRIVSVAAFPLRVWNECVGALFFSYRQRHIFTPEEQELFPIFAEIAAASIQDAWRVIDVGRGAQRLQTASEIARAVGAELDLNEVLRTILATLDQAFKSDAGDEIAPYVLLYRHDEGFLELPSVAREFYEIDNPEYQWRMRLPIDGRGNTCRVARNALAEGRTLVENLGDVHNDPDYIEVNSRTRSELCAGLVSDQRLLGVLVVKSTRPKAFDAEDARLFELLAQQVTVAVDRAEQARLARRQASVAGAMAWAADVAHDINSDVGYIRNRAYWLRMREPILSDEGQAWIQQIDARAQQLASTAQDARSTGYAFELFDLGDTLRTKILGWQTKSCPDVSVSVAGEDVQVSMNREQVWRAVRQLLRNAIEAMEYRGWIKLLVKKNEPLGVEIQIEDSGPGISDDLQMRLFREPVSMKSGEGRGFGLLIAQQLIESMGGSIRLVSSVPKQGTVFAIRLPLPTKADLIQESQYVNN